MEENILISKYLSKLIKKNPSALSLNDDVFFDKKNKIVISVDTYNEGFHFINTDNLNLVIKKTIRASISDLICKGVKPKYYFISFTAKKNTLNKNKIQKIIVSLKEEQKKYDINISGGDTTNGKFFSFTVVVLGFSSKIVKRNTAKLNDDIYVSGNIGDSYIGLKFLKKKIKIFNNQEKKYFINKFYLPEVPIKLFKLVNRFANSSIDISDGIVEDLNKLINRQKYKYQVSVDLIPVSKEFKSILKKNNLTLHKNLFNGDDYQVIFTASMKDRAKIKNYAKRMNQKITIIGQIISYNSKNILTKDNNPIKMTNIKGYKHFI